MYCRSTFTITESHAYFNSVLFSLFSCYLPKLPLCLANDAGVTPALRRRRERAERQRSFMKEQQESAALLRGAIQNGEENNENGNGRSAIFTNYKLITCSFMQRGFSSNCIWCGHFFFNSSLLFFLYIYRIHFDNFNICAMYYV